MTEKIKSQIIAIAESGLTNMFDTKTVQALASRYGFYELVCFIEENKTDYAKFIMHGEC